MATLQSEEAEITRTRSFLSHISSVLIMSEWAWNWHFMAETQNQSTESTSCPRETHRIKVLKVCHVSRKHTESKYCMSCQSLGAVVMITSHASEITTYVERWIITYVERWLWHRRRPAHSTLRCPTLWSLHPRLPSPCSGSSCLSPSKYCQLNSKQNEHIIKKMPWS